MNQAGDTLLYKVVAHYVSVTVEYSCCDGKKGSHGWREHRYDPWEDMKAMGMKKWEHDKKMHEKMGKGKGDMMGGHGGMGDKDGYGDMGGMGDKDGYGSKHDKEGDEKDGGMDDYMNPQMMYMKMEMMKKNMMHAKMMHKHMMQMKMMQMKMMKMKMMKKKHHKKPCNGMRPNVPKGGMSQFLI